MSTNPFATESFKFAPASIGNPLDGILPDFSVFGVEFTELWQKLLGGIWGIVLIASVAMLIISLMKLSAASASSNPGAVAQARSGIVMAGIGLGLVAAVAVVVGAILFIFG